MTAKLPTPDRFLMAILAAAVLASIFPATGAAVPVLSWASKAIPRRCGGTQRECRPLWS